MSGANGKPVRTITVAIDARRRDADTLTTAADIAARVHAELTALFVEDVNLWSLAELPFAVELDRTSGVTRRLDVKAVSHALQADAERVRRLLQLESERCQIATSLKVVRGHYLATAIQATHETDVLVLGVASGLALSAGRRRRISKRPAVEPRRTKPVWILYDGSEAAGRALTLARDFTAERIAELVVAIPDNSNYGDSLRNAQETLGEAPARYQPVADRDAAGFFSALAAQGCMLCVLPRAASKLLEGLPAALLDQLACPLVVVS